MPNYAAFAKFYDESMGDMSQKQEFLKSLISKYAPEAKSVFELACGTGTILEGLSKEYEVAGLDLSPEMVQIAREKVPSADIRVADMTGFTLEKSYDVMLCIYDSINHLLDWQGWQAVFTKAHEYLNEGGLFIFDFNPEKRLEYLTSLPATVTNLGENYMISKIESESNKYYFDEQIFEKREDGLYELHQETVYEVSFPLDQVKEEVAKNFEILEILNNKGLPEEHPNWRPFFVCRKK